MTSLRRFGQLVSDFGGLVDFLVVYVEEAHPVEANHFKNILEVQEHTQLQDRIDAAGVLMQEEGENLLGCKVVVDNMSNDGCFAYAAFPERLYIIQEDKVAFVGECSAMKMVKSIKDAKRWLDKNTGNGSKNPFKASIKRKH